jgi:putative transposase
LNEVKPIASAMGYPSRMTNYRRNFFPGGSFFFTVNLADRRLRLLTDHVDLLRQAFRYVREGHPFEIDAIVVLPDHLHAVWTLPKNDSDFAMRWRLIKAAFSRALPIGERVSESRRGKGERGIWQRRYWEHTLRDEKDFERHVDYIHFNPVKHGYVKRVSDWPHSSFNRMVKLASIPWTGRVMLRRASRASENDRRMG